MVRMDTQMSDEERATVAEAMRRQFHLNCLGNIAQIDTPYLTEGSSGITYVVDRFKGWPHSGHIAPATRRTLAPRRPRGGSAVALALADRNATLGQ